MTPVGPERLRIGLIGYGSWAQRVHIPSIAMSRSAVLAAVCGPDADRARDLAAQHGAQLGTADAAEIIGCPQVDAILIAAPNDVHPPAAIAAATAGKPVLCEKPLAVTLADAKAMTQAAERAEITNMTAFTWRFVPGARLAQALIASGRIGRIFHVSAHFLQGRWLVLDTQRLWRFDRRHAGSGILDDLGVHIFDLLAWIMGERITRACTRLATFGPKPVVHGQEPVFDDAQVLIEFASGAHGTVRLSRIATAAGRPPFPEMHQGVELYGEHGAIIYDLHTHSSLEVRVTNGAAQYVAAPEPLPDSHDEWVVTRELGRRQIEQFASTVRRHCPADPNFRAGLRAQAVVDACARSWNIERWVEVEDVDQHEASAP